MLLVSIPSPFIPSLKSIAPAHGMALLIFRVGLPAIVNFSANILRDTPEVFIINRLHVPQCHQIDIQNEPSHVECLIEQLQGWEVREKRG